MALTSPLFPSGHAVAVALCAAPGIACLGLGFLVLALGSDTTLLRPFLIAGLLGAISVPMAVAILIKGERPATKRPLGVYGKVLIAGMVFVACAGELFWTVTVIQLRLQGARVFGASWL